MRLPPMNDKRLKILSKTEINELYGIPHFTTDEQKSYFALSKKEYSEMTDRGSLASKVHFILQLGYFKTTSQFFDFEFDAVKNDVDYILQNYFDNAKLNVKSVAKNTRLTNQRTIAKLLCYKTDKSDIKIRLRKILEIKAQLSGNPIYLFHEILCYCAERKLMLLGFTTLQDLIGDAITHEEKRLGELLKEHLTHDDWKSIRSMLEKEDDEYVLTELKKDPKSFKPKYLKAEIKKLDNHQPLRQISRKILPILKLTKQNIQYYASLAEHYPVSDLKKLSEIKQAIYILCFVHNRHEKINDNLVSTQ